MDKELFLKMKDYVEFLAAVISILAYWPNFSKTVSKVFRRRKPSNKKRAAKKKRRKSEKKRR